MSSLWEPSCQEIRLLNRNLARAAYVVGFALILIPMFDAGTSVLPLRFAESKWRYGSIGLLSNSLLIPMAGVAIVFAVANAYGHLRTMKILGGIAAVSAVLCLIATGSFTLDALQSQREVRPDLHMAFLVAGGTAVVKLLLGGVAFAFFAAAGLKRLPGESKSSRRDQRLVGELAPKRKQVDATV
jgi:hypothetical protein